MMLFYSKTKKIKYFIDPPPKKKRLRDKNVRDMATHVLGPPQTRVKNAKQMRNTKQNCFSHSSASPRNNKQCSAKQCFANQTNRCLADFAYRSDLFLDDEHG